MTIIPTVGSVARPQAWGYDGAIDNILIRLGVTKETPIEDVTAEAAPPKVDTSELAEDVRDETGRRYSRSNLSGGAGLDFLHSPNRSDDAALRYWDSKGVDVFGTDRGDIYDARLMREMADQDVTGGTGIIDVAAVGGVVYYANTTGIYSEVSGTSTLEATLANIEKMVAMGNSLYTLDTSNGVYRYTPSNWTPVAVNIALYDDIWAVKSRIVGVINNILYDADTDAEILTLPTGETVNDIVDVGPAILVFATTGKVHAMTLNDSLALIPAGETPFVDEIPIMAVSSFGTIGLVTAETTETGGKVARFYTATLGVSAAYTLENLQLIFQVGDRDTTDDLTPHAMLATRDSIYVAIHEEDDTEITLWRYYTPTGGYARAHSVDPVAAHTASSMVELDDRMWVAIPGHDLWKETDLYVTVGYVIGPLADFYTADTKQWVGGELSGVALTVGQGLELYETNDPIAIQSSSSQSWALVTKFRTGDTKRTSDLFTGANARYHAAMVILKPAGSQVTSPGFRSYSFRALPNPDRDILIRIPINVSDQIDSPGKRSISVPGRGDAIDAALLAYEGRQVVIELYRPALLVRGLIEKFESVIETISERGAVRRIRYCLIRGTSFEESTGYGATTTGANLGIGALGLKVVGTREEYDAPLAP